MTEEDELDAAERALGTMAIGRETPTQVTARAVWDARFAPLTEFIDPVVPPDDLFDEISARLVHETETDYRGALILLAERRVTRWRATAFAAMAASVAMAVWIAVQPVPLAKQGQRYIAAMTRDGGQSVVVDVAAGIATVWPVPSQDAERGAFEVWHVRGDETPVSLGLASAQATVDLAVAAAPGDAIAISLEPVGGSPTGQPTGAVLFSGVLQARE